MEINPALIYDSVPHPEPVPDAANDGDRREHNRNVKVMRVARLKNVKLHAECLGLVRDVSSGGMQIDADFPMEIGQAVSVALLDDQELNGNVVWIEGKTVGVKFDQPIIVEQILARPSLKADGRRARLARFKVSKAVKLGYNDKSIDAELIDLSQRGAKLFSDGKFKMHSNILVRLSPICAVRASVQWQAGTNLGVEFHRLLTVEELGIWLGDAKN